MARINAINNFTQELTLDPGASGDSFVQFDINAIAKFRIGVDDTDDSFRISQGSALGTKDTMVITAAGEVTKPLTPAFLVILTSTKSNQTGNGTTYTVSWDSEIFDQNGDFATTTFTAPVTGRYRFETSVYLGGLTAAGTDGILLIDTSNRDYKSKTNPGGIADASNEFSTYTTVMADMDALDTATVKITVSNEASDVVDIMSNGASDPYTWWSGSLEV